jgi:hypothetical protein
MMVELAAGKRADSLRELGRWLDNITGQTDPVTQTLVGGGGAPANASYVTINNTPDLSRERALAVADPINLTDGGANGSVTIGIDADAFDGRYLKLDAGNDPVTGALDVQVNAEHALRVLDNTLVMTDAGELWLFESGGIYYTENYDAVSPTWAKVAGAMPNVGTLLRACVASDGTAVYLAYNTGANSGIYKCENPKAATPVWEDILVGEKYNVHYLLAYGGNFDMGIYKTTLWATAWADGEDIFAAYHYGVYDGTTWAWYGRSSVMDYTGSLPKTYGLMISSFGDIYYDLGTYAVMHDGSNTNDASSTLWSFSADDQVCLNDDRADRSIKYLFLPRLPERRGSALTNFQDGASLYVFPAIVNGSLEGNKVFVINSRLDDATHRGEIWIGDTTTGVALKTQWLDAQRVHDTRLAGGGSLVVTIKGCFSGGEVARLSTDGGDTWTDITGNFWSVTTGDKTFINSGMTYTAGDFTTMFNVDTLTGDTDVVRLIASQTVQGTRLLSTTLTGTAPLGVSSTTLNTNLNADMLDGSHASAFVPVTRTISTTAPLTGGGDLSANRTFAMPAATALSDGYLTSADWSTFNAKQPAGAYLTSVTVDAPLTGAGTAASHLSMPAATSLVSGYLTNTDWATFNGKQSAYTILGTLGALANAAGWLHNDGSGVLAYSTPTKTDVGLGNVENTALSTWAGSTNLTTLGTVATGTWQGSAIADSYIASAATWNAKQPAGNYITALTGDVTASGPGSAAATLATVNASPGSYTYATLTVNAKGLVTAASSGTAPVTGAGAANQIAYFSGTSTITSGANLTWAGSGNMLLTGDFASVTTGTATSGTVQSGNFIFNYTPSGSSSAITRAGFFRVITAGANNPGTLNGLACQVNVGTTTATVSGIASGGQFIVSKTGATGTITNAFGGEFYVQSGSTSGGAIGSARGGSFGYTGGAGTVAVTNAYAAYIIAGSAGGGTITNLHGLYIEALVAGGTLNRAITTNGGQLDFTHNADSTLATFTGAGTFTATTPLVSMIRNDAATAVTVDMLKLEARTTGAGATGFGPLLRFTAESASTNTYRDQAAINSTWGLNSSGGGAHTDAGRTSTLAFQTVDNAGALTTRLQIYGALTRIGDASNYTQFAADGTLTLAGTAKYERHIQIPAKSDGTVANQPTPVDFFTVGGNQYATTGAKYGYCQFEVPDDWDGTNMFFEIDWFPDSGAMSGTDTVEWTVEYRAIAEGELINNGTSVTLTSTDSADYSQYQTKHARVTLAFNNANQPLTIQDHVFVKISRNTAVANDFSGSVTVSGYEVIYTSNGFPTAN